MHIVPFALSVLAKIFNNDYHKAMLEKGLVQIYTGDGKGKTTAAFGLAFRSCGAGNRVLIYQFLKPESLKLSERDAIKSCGLDIELEILEMPWDMRVSLDDPCVCKLAREKIQEACSQIQKYASSRKYDVIILDEIVFCHYKSLVTTEAIKELINSRDSRVEIVMTGRGAKQDLIELADLVSEIKSVKHPYQSGVNARKGIEY